MKVLEFKDRLRKGQRTILLPEEITKEQSVRVVILSSAKDDPTDAWEFWEDAELDCLGKTSGLKTTSS